MTNRNKCAAVAYFYLTKKTLSCSASRQHAAPTHVHKYEHACAVTLDKHPADHRNVSASAHTRTEADTELLWHVTAVHGSHMLQLLRGIEGRGGRQKKRKTPATIRKPADVTGQQPFKYSLEYNKVLVRVKTES